jgi:hypothetical protein
LPLNRYVGKPWRADHSETRHGFWQRLGGVGSFCKQRRVACVELRKADVVGRIKHAAFFVRIVAVLREDNAALGQFGVGDDGGGHGGGLAEGYLGKAVLELAKERVLQPLIDLLRGVCFVLSACGRL